MDTERFIKAQEGGEYDRALNEIHQGCKTGHWIWYVFPQMRGLGHSYMSDYYGISSIDEAKEYASHPLLGLRLREITEALLELPKEMTAREILGGIDAMKVKSSMTLFHLATGEQLFMDVLNRFYNGATCKPTTRMLGIKQDNASESNRRPNIS